MFAWFRKPAESAPPDASAIAAGEASERAIEVGRANDADRADRRGLMAALDEAQCLLWFDPDGRILESNANTQDLLGLSEDYLSEMTFQDLAGEPDQHHEYFAKHWGRIASGALRAEERELVGNDCRVWASITYAAVKRGDGQTRRVFALIIDLSPWSAKPKGVFARLG